MAKHWTFLHTLKSAFVADDFTFAGGPSLPTMTPIESAGATTLASSANHFYLLDSTGAGPSLKYHGTDVTAGQFGGYTPVGAEKTGMLAHVPQEVRRAPP